jgi:hypothetical protein
MAFIQRGLSFSRFAQQTRPDKKLIQKSQKELSSVSDKECKRINDLEVNRAVVS